MTSFDKEKYKKNGVYRLSSGQLSRYYYDIKEAMGRPDELNRMFLDIEKELPPNYDMFVGIESGGVPLAVICSLKTGKPFAILRKEKKSYGTKKVIEGYQNTGKVVLLDDVETTGESLYKAEMYLNTRGYQVIKKITVVKR